MAALVGLTVATLAACGRSEAESQAPASAPSTAAPPAPTDHLAPGELLEGPATAFGMHLPRGLSVNGAVRDLVVASGPLQVHPVVDYFKARLRGGDLREGETSATFDHVTVNAQPGPELRLHIGVSPEGVRVEIRDETVPAVPPLADEGARWRRVGLTPDGHLADPTHLE